MRIITKEFFKTTRIPRNKDTERAMDFLAHPQNVEKMIQATEDGKPALSAVVAELEDIFGDCKGFPLKHDKENKNVKNRRNVGWMVRYIMREYGYTPIDGSGKTRIGSKSGSRYFQNAALYERSGKPARRIFTRVYHSPYNWKENSMFASESDDDYAYLKKKTSRIFKAIKVLDIGKKRVLEYMLETGYGECYRDLTSVFTEEKVPCIEVMEDIDATVQLLVFCDGKNETLLAMIKSGVVLDVGNPTVDIIDMRRNNNGKTEN